MIPRAFEGAYLKLERARAHIYELEARLKEFVGREPYAAAIEQNQDGSLSLFLELREPLPQPLGLVIGDAIHNIRTALDHATWALVGLDRGTQDRWTKLPASSTNQVDYESMCRGMKTPRDDTKNFLVGLKVYPGGNENLLAIHQLDNMDKHQVLVPHIAAAAIGHLRVIGPDLDMTMQGGAVSPDADGVVRLKSFGPGTKIAFDEKTKITASIFFGKDQPFAGEPVIDGLWRMRMWAGIALNDFSVFVNKRD